MKKFILFLLILLLPSISFSELDRSVAFSDLVKQAEQYFERGEYQKIIDLLEPYQSYNLDIPVDQYYKALILRGNSYICTNRFLDGMSDFREINGMSVNQEPYPIYMCALFSTLCQRYDEAKEFSNNLPAIYINTPEYYLIVDYLLTFIGSSKRDDILKEILNLTNLPFYKKNPSEFWKCLVQYVNGKIDYSQLLSITPTSEIIPIKLLAGLRTEKIEGSFNKAQQYYYDVYNNTNGFYHWLAGKQLGVKYIYRIPAIINIDGVMQQEEIYKFKASSSLYGETQKYPVANIFDNDPNTAWVEYNEPIKLTRERRN